MKTFIDTINFGVKNWWVSLLLGLLYILIAICLMFTPLASYVALSVLFSVSHVCQRHVGNSFCRHQ